MTQRRWITVAAALAAAGASAADEAARPMMSMGTIGGGMMLRGQPQTADGHQEGAAGAGFYARPGLRVSALTSVELEASWVTQVVQNAWRLALTTGFTPFRWLSLALGPVYSGFNGVTQTSAYGNQLGGTVRLDVHPWANEKHRGITVSVAADVGKTITIGQGDYEGSVISNGMSTGLFATVGYTF